VDFSSKKHERRLKLKPQRPATEKTKLLPTQAGKKKTRSEAGLDSGLWHFVSAKVHKFKTLRAENFGKDVGQGEANRS
jgi:hypothetical protein